MRLRPVFDISEVVKVIALKGVKKSRGGLMLGVADLGNHSMGFLGGWNEVGEGLLRRVAYHEIRNMIYKLTSESCIVHKPVRVSENPNYDIQIRLCIMLVTF